MWGAGGNAFTATSVRAEVRLDLYKQWPTSRRPSGFRLRRSTVEKGGARIGVTTDRPPWRIGYCVGVASAARTVNALRHCSINAIRWTCWRRFGATKPIVFSTSARVREPLIKTP